MAFGCVTFHMATLCQHMESHQTTAQQQHPARGFESSYDVCIFAEPENITKHTQTIMIFASQIWDLGFSVGNDSGREDKNATGHILRKRIAKSAF